MFKISKRDLKMLLVLGGLLAFLLLYFWVVTPFQEKADQTEAKVAELETQVAKLEELYANLSNYEMGIANFKEEIADDLEAYPGGVEYEDFLVYLLDVEYNTGLALESVTFDEPSMIAQFDCEVTVDGEPQTRSVSAWRTGATVGGKQNYPELKNSINYLYDTESLTALDSVTVNFDSSTGELSALYTISKYYMTWDGSAYNPLPVPAVDKGISDLFGTT